MMRDWPLVLLAFGGFALQAAPVTAVPAPAAPPAAAAGQVENPPEPRKVIAREAKIPAAYVALYDLDGDGRLSEAELAAAIKKMMDASLPALFPECDKDANGKLDGAESVAALAAALKEYDLDGDGRLDFREAVKMNQAAKVAATKELRREKAVNKVPAFYVDRYDLDGDGKLNDAELVVAARRMADANLQVLFKELDKDGNGILEGTEHEKARALALKEYDLNGDGKFDFDEATKMTLKAKEVQRGQLQEKLARNHKERLVQRYDLDGDGKLNEEETRRAKEMKQDNIKAPPLDE